MEFMSFERSIDFNRIQNVSIRGSSSAVIQNLRSATLNKGGRVIERITKGAQSGCPLQAYCGSHWITITPPCEGTHQDPVTTGWQGPLTYKELSGLRAEDPPDIPCRDQHHGHLVIAE